MILKLLLVLALGFSRSPKGADVPNTLVYNGSALAWVRERLRQGDPELMPALKKLTGSADRLLDTGGNWTVMVKAMTPPSGTKHDYESIGPYWWPCNNKTADSTAADVDNWVITKSCNKTTGLPWVRHDGVHNPITDQFDSNPNFHMTGAVQTLSAAYYFSKNKTYATKAVSLLKQWFLDPATLMRPNLNFGQMIPGVCDGRGIGIIDTAGWWGLVESFALLAVDGGIPDETHHDLQQWFHNYTVWLMTSKNGKDESNAKNNHGTWYDVQTQSFALFGGLSEAAKSIATEVPKKRIDVEIKPDGQMPMAFFNLASVSQNSGVNLWTYASKDGQSIHKALDWIIPYATGKAKWPFKQITSYSWGSMFSLFRRASLEFDDPKYEELISSLPDVHSDDVINLLFPRRFSGTQWGQHKHSNSSHSPSESSSYIELDGFELPRYFYRSALL